MIDKNQMKKERLTELLCTSRARYGMTQEAMALELGVARKTIQNWEKGITFPDMIQTIQWFEALNMNPMSFIFQYRYPDRYGNQDPFQESHDSDEIRKTLHDMIALLPEDGLKQLLYVYYGDHGSDPRGLINLLNAYLQTPLKDRLVLATAIMKNYELSKGSDNLISADGVQPDLDYLKHLSEMCEEAVYKDKKHYTSNYKVPK